MEPEVDKNAVARWLEGKKTYAVCAAILVCGILAMIGIHIPEFVWLALNALGLGFLRAGVNKPIVIEEAPEE